MKKLECYAILSKEDNRLMYFTDNKDQLELTEWLKSNATILPVTLRKNELSGWISYVFCISDTTIFLDMRHSEDNVFSNLPGSFTTDILHHSNYDNDTLQEWLLDSLPHGSGINGSWDFMYLKNGKIQAHNCYEGMNENGYYCHNADFTVTLHINHLFRLVFDSLHLTYGSREYSCCLYDIKSYLSDVIAESLHDERKI